MKKSYKQYRKEVEQEQADMTPEQIEEMMAKRSEYLLDINNLPPVKHYWVDRGLVMSCEGATHPNHRVFKRR